jgi:hypothetical protein
MAEFKIGRLRYNWSGTWQTGSVYPRDSFVEFNGKTYSCLIPHTAGNFVDDLNAGNWLLTVSGTGWRNLWAPNITYDIGSIVSYGGNLYVSIIAHASAADYTLGLEANSNDWTILVSSSRYVGDWSATARYIINDVVKKGPDLWITNVGQTPTSTFDLAKWSIFIPGFEIAGQWDQAITYQPGDTVKYGGYEYVSLTANNHNNTPSVDAVDWQLMVAGYEIADDWVGVGTYKVGNVVRRHGRTYAAIKDSTGQDPSGFIVSKSYTAAGSSGTTLKVNSTTNIFVGSLLYGAGFTAKQAVVSITDSNTLEISAGPDGEVNDGQSVSFVGVNGTYWTMLVPSNYWTNRWIKDTDYVTDDLVVWRNVTYVCVRNHTSNEVFPPDLDVQFTYWAYYALHARTNVLYKFGQILTYNNLLRVPVDINRNSNDQVLVDQVLKTVNSLPTWSYINRTTNVFYVAPNGIDRSDYGNSWDQPWKSIKYACEFIGAGTMYANAKFLITVNKAWATHEMYQWMEFQRINGTAPFNPASHYDQTKTIRDASYIIDALLYDISRGGNSQTVAATKAYFKQESNHEFVTAEVAAEIPYFIAALEKLLTLLINVLTNTSPTVSYQQLNLNSIPYAQTTGGAVAEQDAVLTVTGLMNIVISALVDGNTNNIPNSNGGLTYTVNVKTGTYQETLPIVIPANTALVGDELRGTVVQPKVVINTVVTGVTTITSQGIDPYDAFVVSSTAGMADKMAVQFTGSIGGVTAGQTYYIKGSSILPDSFGIVEHANDTVLLSLSDDPGSMNVYGGDAIKDMFYVRNGTGIRNMSLTGLLGTLSALDEYQLQRPTGGSFVSLDPGLGPDDTSAWIYRRSPYCQNVSLFGNGCTGVKIDGTLHNGGNRSIVANDYTTIISDGIGAWCTGPEAKTELISVFAYYSQMGYFAENGGRIRAANGNSSYGTFGVVALGYDSTETPGTGIVFNRSTQVQANVQQSFGNSSQIVKFFYTNNGSRYNVPVTNFLAYSNNFLTGSWSTDSNVSIQKNTLAPTGYPEAWTLTGVDSVAGQDYISQTVSINNPGNSYVGITYPSAVNVTGSGTGASFDVVVTSTAYVVTINNPGSGYVNTNQIKIPGAVLGGITGANDLTITVTALSGTAIYQIQTAGTVPPGSALSYTLSVYAKKGSAASFDLYGIFSGTGSPISSSINFNFNTGVVTPSNSLNGFTPVNYGAVPLTNGWYRVWVAVNDTTAANTSLTYRIYPRGYFGTANTYTYFYGSQLELSSAAFTPGFYLESTATKYSGYANFEVVGNGSGVVVVGDEIRSRSVFQTRVTDPGSGAGGTGYLTASNNAQVGDTVSITLAASDINLAANYLGMRVFINSGTGSGQYGYISSYDTVSKTAQILKESFETLRISATDNGSSQFTLAAGDINTLYLTQPVQFIPTYYTTVVTAASLAQCLVTAAVGGIINTLTVASTANMRVNMRITFSAVGLTQQLFSTVVAGYTYYINAIIDSTTIQISTEQYGAVWLLNTVATGEMTANFPSYTNYFTAPTNTMVVNYPIEFTGSSVGGITVGSTYYINDVIDSNNFSISTALLTSTCTSTLPPTDGTYPNSVVLSAPNTSLVALNPIVFSSGVFGTITDGTKFYISKIQNSTHIQLCSALLTVNATATAQNSSLITVSSTVGFVVNNPIKFVGFTIGGIEADRIYYIQAINDAQTFTISTAVNGSAFPVSNDTGLMTLYTGGTTFVQSASTGSMTATSTTAKASLNFAPTGLMTGTYSTPLFGGINSGQTYYINNIFSNAFTVGLTSGSGTPVALQTKTGSMNIGEVGWDNVNIGVPAVATLDSSSVYYIEPRLAYAEAPFNQTVTIPPVLSGPSWVAIGYGNNYWVGLPSSGTVASRFNGVAWTSVTLPTSASWTAVTYGAGYWVAISSGGSGNSTALYSFTDGITWTSRSLPSATTWSHTAYGNGVFVAIATGTNTSAYSNNFGDTWTAGSGLPNAAWTGLTYGAGRFVAVSNGSGSGSSVAAYSLDGITWVSSTLPAVTTWSSIAFGNNIFVAVSNTISSTAYSLDGINWNSSNLTFAADKIIYGQGIFLALLGSDVNAWICENGRSWRKKTVSADSYICGEFGFATSSADYLGQFVTLASSGAGSRIFAGSRTKARPLVTSGVITGISSWEPGSGYTAGAPTLSITDPNATSLAVTVQRLGDGALASPTFVNRGTGYNTTSTVVLLNGNGYADQYQTGLSITLNNLTRLPQPGDSLTIDGVSEIYKVTAATSVFGTVVPNLEANVQISPAMVAAFSPDNGTAISLRSRYSQARLTNHDFLDIGVGGQLVSKYPAIDTNNDLPQNQTVEVNYGRVFFVSTDQDGNFKVGNLFGVQQATGIVTISASQFGLSGLNSLKLGGIAVGGNSVIVTQFSTDASFTANSDSIIPTQKAIKSYLSNRLTQGGANTFTGLLIAGTVQIGGPNKIGSTIPNGQSGSRVKMVNKVNITGALAGIDGGLPALQMFLGAGNHKSTTF